MTTTIQQYSDLAARTVKWQPTQRDDLFHAGLGLSDETGEFNSAIKSNLIYGKPADEINLVEELGDAAWFINLGALSVGLPLEVVLLANIAKLNVRYAEGYSDAKALGRDKEMERDAIKQVIDNYRNRNYAAAPGLPANALGAAQASLLPS